jgi:hypothetical protein
MPGCQRPLPAYLVRRPQRSCRKPPTFRNDGDYDAKTGAAISPSPFITGPVRTPGNRRQERKIALADLKGKSGWF